MTNPLSIFSWITLGLWSVAVVYIFRGAKTASAGMEQQKKTWVAQRVLKIAGMLYLFALIYFPRYLGLHARPMTTHVGQGAVGAALCSAGVALFIASRRVLGGNWSDLAALKRNHALIQSGPYCWVRHPLYSGMLLAVVGSAVTVNTLIAYAVVPILLLGFWVKSRKEEALLTQRFPEYRGYRRRVKAFIPFVF